MVDNTNEQHLQNEETEKIPDSQSNALSIRAKSRKKDILVYAKNPYWDVTEVKIGTKRVTIAGGFVSKENTGETMSVAGIHRVEAVDEDKFVKLFTQNSALFFDLSRPAQKLLRFVLGCVQNNPGKDGIWFAWWDIEDWIKATKTKGLSRTSFHRALAELLTKKLLAESEKPNFYWINPHVFFNGDRLVYIQEYRKIKATPKLDKTETKALENNAPQLEGKND